MVVGTVVEGVTDHILLEEIILELFPDARVLPPLQPTSPGKGGWRDIQKWCQEIRMRRNSNLEKIISGETGEKLDLLVIQVDGDIARHSETDLQKNVINPVADVLQPCPPIRDTIRRLKQVVARWLNYDSFEQLPAEVILAIPSQDIETWVFAALFPDHSLCGQPDYECFQKGHKKPAYLLTFKKHGKIRKNRKIYRSTGPKVAEAWKTVCNICSQARAFNDDLYNRRP